jgi:large subunit ribosomal protein L15
MPLQRRLPKRGFTNIFKNEYNIINVEDLNKFEPNAKVDADALREKGLLTKKRIGVKLLGNGQVGHPIVIEVERASRSAREKIEAAGGKVEII